MLLFPITVLGQTGMHVVRQVLNSITHLMFFPEITDRIWSKGNRLIHNAGYFFQGNWSDFAGMKNRGANGNEVVWGR